MKVGSIFQMENVKATGKHVVVTLTELKNLKWGGGGIPRNVASAFVEATSEFFLTFIIYRVYRQYYQLQAVKLSITLLFLTI